MVGAAHAHHPTGDANREPIGDRAAFRKQLLTREIDPECGTAGAACGAERRHADSV